jgi:hypothetical protein
MLGLAAELNQPGMTKLLAGRAVAFQETSQVRLRALPDYRQGLSLERQAASVAGRPRWR